MSELRDPSNIVGRLAPSPTGHLHLGHARSFLIAWWHARQRGGSVRLRFEDLDQARSRQCFVDDALSDLEWLGLDWDGEVVHQSERLEAIRDAARKLERAKLAYWCVCSRTDIQALSAPHGPDGSPIYPRTCDGRFSSLFLAERDGALAGLRFRTQDEPVKFTDALHGDCSERLSFTSGDFLLLRRDKVPAYQLAVVVDDAAQSVTEVIRGDDLLASTARQVALLRALDLQVPSYAHVPLVLSADGRRLAKRHASLSLKTLREQNVDPKALVRYILSSTGVQSQERLTARAAASLFDLEKVPRAAVRIDESNLLSRLSKL